MSESTNKLSRNEKIKLKKQQLETAKIGDTIGTYGIFMGERGIYDTRNKLNNLTGKEWVFFTNSVWITAYPPSSTENIGVKHRKIHPSPKPPGLLRDIIQFFTKPDSTILDPFAGVGGTLLGTALAGENRKCIGIELEQRYIEAYKKCCQAEQLEEMIMINDDSSNMLNHEIIMSTQFDLIVADPPYSDMMNKKRTGQKKKLYDFNEATPYTDSEHDLGNLSKDQYFESLLSIVTAAASRLKTNKYFILFCKDFQPQKDSPNILHADIINLLSGVEGLQYRGMRIWHDQAMDLYPFGYPFGFVMNQIHQYILIFRKES